MEFVDQTVKAFASALLGQTEWLKLSVMFPLPIIELIW
jgi:hypothetical protein